MKGLELCRRYFFEIGLPAIQNELSECIPYITAGLAIGSQCHGNDDEVSRDHGWGPGFSIWLNESDKNRFEVPLKGILDKLPREFLGYKWNKKSEAAMAFAIFDLDAYFKAIVGFEKTPLTGAKWLTIPEENLFEITRRPIFFDPKGEVSQRFESFKSYPEDVWKKRLAQNLVYLWLWSVRYGVKRAFKRGDLITARLLWGRFSEFAMKVGFLLSREYAPYEKWRYVQFAKLPEHGHSVGECIRRGLDEPSELPILATRIEQIYIEKLESFGFKPFDFTKLHPDSEPSYDDLVLTNYARSIIDSIKDDSIDKALTILGA